MIRFKDICVVNSKQFSVETRDGQQWIVSLTVLPDGVNQILSVKRPNSPDVVIATLPSEVVEAIHEITI